MPSSQLRQAFGQHLREARKGLGLQQKSVGELVEVDESVVSRWESGVHLPLPKQLPAIARALELDLADLALRHSGASIEETTQLRKQNAKLQAEKNYYKSRIDEMLASNERLNALLERLAPRLERMVPEEGE